MNKIIALIVFIILLISCQTNDDGGSLVTKINSSITINGVAIVPTELSASEPITVGEGSQVFILQRKATNQAILVKIYYPLNSSISPNGVYDLGVGEIDTTLFAKGGYIGNNIQYSFSGSNVEVTKLTGINKYKLNFQNSQALEINSENIIIISGSCQGTFNLDD